MKPEQCIEMTKILTKLAAKIGNKQLMIVESTTYQAFVYQEILKSIDEINKDCLSENN
jgi:hypothetical protein